ncbi:MAG TPA: DUF2520 domain-containing protein [Gemmatimonadetes bacterium]|nr:DUF2520 domain-containing protein [Gemmatimonadota bacterium]
MGDRLLVVGSGRAGLALGYALWQGEALESLSYCGRQPEPPTHPLFMEGLARYFFGLERPGLGITAVLLAVPDGVLPEMAHMMAGQGDAPEGCVALHCSGTLSVEVLAPLRARGYYVGSLHPLQALAHPVTGAERLPGSWFAVSGEHEAITVARRLVARLDGTTLTVPIACRPLYHAAAVVASNYLPVLLALAARLLVLAGGDEDEAIPALLPLMRGTLDNIAELGLAPALTGPISRGDVETVRLHLGTLPDRESRVYRDLGREAVALAEARGLEGETVAVLRDLFETPVEAGA